MCVLLGDKAFFLQGRYQWKMRGVEQVVNVTEPDFDNPNNNGMLNNDE